MLPHHRNQRNEIRLYIFSSLSLSHVCDVCVVATEAIIVSANGIGASRHSGDYNEIHKLYPASCIQFMSSNKWRQTKQEI